MTSSYGRLPGDRNIHKMGESRRVKILVGIIIVLVIVLLVQHRSDPPVNTITEKEEDSFIATWKADSQLNKVYAITPTYARPVQKAELTRISHVVQLSPNIHWIIVEDASERSDLVRNVVRASGLKRRTTILYKQTPKPHKQNVPNYQQPRGVEQRNAALKWLRDNRGDPNQYHQAVVYFMDDDNTYTVQLFREMAKIESGRVGVWPVGLVGGLMAERPILDENDDDKVIGFNSQWRPERPFPVDMAGFAISLDLLIANPEAKFSYNVERGYQETEILRQVTTLSRLQPLANRCTKVLVWHTRTEQPKLGAEEKMNRLNIHSHDGMEVRR